MASQAAAGMAPAAPLNSPAKRRAGLPAPPLKTPPYDRFGRFLQRELEDKPENQEQPEKARARTIEPATQVLAGQIASELSASAAAWDAGQAAEYFSSQATAGRVLAFARGLADRLSPEVGLQLMRQVSPMVQEAVSSAGQGKKGKAPSQKMLNEAARLIKDGKTEGALGPGVRRGLDTVFRNGPPKSGHGGVLLREI